MISRSSVHAYTRIFHEPAARWGNPKRLEGADPGGERRNFPQFSWGQYSISLPADDPLDWKFRGKSFYDLAGEAASLDD